MRGLILNRVVSSKLYPNIESLNPRNDNTLSVVNKLVELLKEMKFQYVSKQKIAQLESQDASVDAYNI